MVLVDATPCSHQRHAVQPCSYVAPAAVTEPARFTHPMSAHASQLSFPLMFSAT